MYINPFDSHSHFTSLGIVASVFKWPHLVEISIKRNTPFLISHSLYRYAIEIEWFCREWILEIIQREGEEGKDQRNIP